MKLEQRWAVRKSTFGIVEVRYFRWRWLAWMYFVFWLPPFGPLPVYCSPPKRERFLSADSP